MTLELHMRKTGTAILAKQFKSEKNISIMEKYIYSYSCGDNNKYMSSLYDIMYFNKKGSSVKEIIQWLKTGKMGIDHPSMKIYKEKQIEHDEYLVNPFQVIDGIVNCKKCGSKNTLSYSKQDRKADEPLSVYCQCVDCKHKWRENN